MKDPRLIYRVILKLFALSGILLLSYVLVGSLFIESTDERPVPSHQKLNKITLDLSKMRHGSIKNTHWNGYSLLVLKQLTTPVYQVFYNTGDSGNCPLFYANRIFKDTCTGTRYDFSGKEINRQTSPKRLKSPAYTVRGDLITIGE